MFLYVGRFCLVFGFLVFFAPPGQAQSLKAVAKNLKTVTKQVKSIDATLNNASASLATLKSRVDSIDITLQSAISGSTSGAASGTVGSATQSLASTSWTGQVFYLGGATGEMDSNVVPVEKSIALTFTPSTETEGDWTSSPYSVAHPRGDHFRDECSGSWAGRYKILRDYIYFWGATGPCQGYTNGSAIVSTRKNSLLFSSFSNEQSASALFTRQ